jgi:hypothetical protein
MGARLPTYRLMTRKSCRTASWLVVTEYRLTSGDYLDRELGFSGGSILKASGIATARKGRTGLLRRMLPAYFGLLRNAGNIRSRVPF